MKKETREILKSDYEVNLNHRKSRLFLSIFRRLQNENNYVCKKVWKLLLWLLFRNQNLDINERAVIGKGLRLPHAHGIVISGYAKIGDYCTIYHQVTLGANEHKINYKNAPQLGKHVYIGAGAKIIGSIKIGDNVVIGANAVVTKDVPDGYTVVGNNQMLELKHDRNF